jgi:hypothetical protein
VQPQHGGGIDAFVTRLSPAGDAIYYSTFLGGGGDDRANAVAVSYSKAAHVVGSTTSPDFPIVAAVQPSPGGATDAFVAKLSEDGLFDFSTFVGDGGFDEARDVAVDAARNIFVAGDLGSDDLVCLEPRGRAFTTAWPCRDPPRAAPWPWTAGATRPWRGRATPAPSRRRMPSSCA